jgi:hypothetical protein
MRIWRLSTKGTNERLGPPAEVILYFNMGLYPHVETMGMMERFAREVAPAFTEA